MSDMELEKGHLKVLNNGDLRLGFVFMRGHSAEVYAHELFREGYLRRRWRIYSVKAGGKSISMRWAYRLSAKGIHYLTTQPASPQSDPKGVE